LLFSANRWEAAGGMLSALGRGQHLVVDRYAYSGVAFSGSKVLPAGAAPLSLEWAGNSDRGLPAPDLVIFLDISLEAAAKRGSFGAERYETQEIQKRVREAFTALRTQAAAAPAAAASSSDAPAVFGAGVPWVVVDAAGTQDEVAAQIEARAREAIDRVTKEQPPIRFL